MNCIKYDVEVIFLAAWCSGCVVCAGCAACDVGCVSCAGCFGCVITPTPDFEIAITGTTAAVTKVAGVGALVGLVAW